MQYPLHGVRVTNAPRDYPGGGLDLMDVAEYGYSLFVNKLQSSALVGLLQVARVFGIASSLASRFGDFWMNHSEMIQIEVDVIFDCV